MDSTDFNSELFLIQYFAFMFIFGLITYVINSIVFALFFKKVGEEPWKAWVPFLNTWIFFKLGGQNPLLSLLILTAIIPFVGFFGVMVAAVYACIAAYHIGLGFGKEGWWVAIYIFAPLVWMLVLTFDNSVYNRVVAENPGMPAQPNYYAPPVNENSYGYAPASPPPPTYGTVNGYPVTPPPVEPTQPAPRNPYLSPDK